MSALETRALRPAATRSIDQVVARLGTTAAPYLSRTLRDGTPIAREAARAALIKLADRSELTRTRVLDAVRSLITDDSSDDVKVCALGLLAELGAAHASGTAKFSDPVAIQRRSALALAAQLETANEIANAADMMVKQLDDRDVVQMLEVLCQVAPAAAHRLAGELALRLDVDREQRAKIAAVVDGTPATDATRPRPTRPTHVAVLVDASGRIVVVATRKHPGERRWRRWAVLIGESGCIEDCLHEDAAPDGALDPTASLIANLCADGYRVASSELDHARTLVATAARRTVRMLGTKDHALASAYYLGRDLLDLRDAHVIADLVETPTLAKAIDLLASGDAAAARALFERCSPEAAATADWAGGYGACLLALGELAAAVAPLERAIASEPTWPLHHWNLAVALHRLGDLRACQAALRRFLSTSATPSGLVDDLDQPVRIAYAKTLIAELERIARIDRAGRRAAASRPRATASKKRKKR